MDFRFLLRILFILGLLSGEAQASSESFPFEDAPLRAFESDGCTGWREGPPENPDQWLSCCFEHDLRYWAGGSKKLRRDADHRLKACVRATGAVTESEVMALGIAIGSLSPFKLAGKQWGNAWGSAVRQTALSRAEYTEIENAVRQYSVPPQLVDSLLYTLREDAVLRDLR